ncbi:uncharacterized protein LOC132563795, partial [Ylistrum balloti]|uniref:uncharacterized protein LOC132563795 n=1 Tax=Ylistrum balloti TaxID=509963 RepID=UPI002905D47A
MGSTSDTESVNASDETVSDNANGTSATTQGSFMYLPVYIEGQTVAALLDTGSSINVMSRSFYDKLSVTVKTSIDTSTAVSISLADSHTIPVQGTANIKAKTPYGSCTLSVYILQHTSHPLILGSAFMTNHSVVLDFGSINVGYKKLKVRCKTRLAINPNSECMVWCKLPKYSTVGLQGVCTGSKKAMKAGLLVARSVSTIPHTRKVPVKLLNPGNTIITIPSYTVLAYFETMDNSYHVLAHNSGVGCNNIIHSNGNSDFTKSDIACSEVFVHSSDHPSVHVKPSVSESDVHSNVYDQPSVITNVQSNVHSNVYDQPNAPHTDVVYNNVVQSHVHANVYDQPNVPRTDVVYTNAVHSDVPTNVHDQTSVLNSESYNNVVQINVHENVNVQPSVSQSNVVHSNDVHSNVHVQPNAFHSNLVHTHHVQSNDNVKANVDYMHGDNVDFDKFISYFHVNENLTEVQK